MPSSFKPILGYCLIFCTIVMIFIALFVPMATAGGYKLYFWASVAPTNCAMADACGGKTHLRGLLFPMFQIVLNWLTYWNISAIHNSDDPALKTSVSILFVLDFSLLLFILLIYVVNGDDIENTTTLGGYIYALLSFIMVATNFVALFSPKYFE